MIEKNKGISLIIAILSVIVLIIIVFFVYQEFFSFKGEKENINFLKTGNLIINNPGLENNIWYLSYESQGSPAKLAKLSFDEDSVCRNKVDSCSELNVGERVDVKGVEKNGEVLVKEIKLDEASD
jgi:hypothetical protein